MKKIIIQIVLGAIVVVLAYLCVSSVMKPLKFEEIKKQRNDRVVQSLKDIRTAQEAYKSIYGKYTGSFDTLIHFVKYDSLKQLRAIGDLTDDQLEAGMTEIEAVRKGLIIRDTIRIPVLESIFSKDYPADNLRYVPFTNRKHEFQMRATILPTDSDYNIPVFEARVVNTVIFENLFEEYGENIREYNWERIRFDKYPGLKVGNIEEANNNVGNWE